MATIKTMTECEVCKSAMKDGFVKFTYYKADGTLRTAIGTTNRELITTIGYRLIAKEREHKQYYENLNGYFDLMRFNWRRFNSERFVHIEYESLTIKQAAHEALVECQKAGVDRNDIVVNGLMTLCSDLGMINPFSADYLDGVSVYVPHNQASQDISESKTIPTTTRSESRMSKLERLLVIRTKIAELEKEEQELIRMLNI